MENQSIKTKLKFTLVVLSMICFCKNVNGQSIDFKILNYKKVYAKTDTVKLLVKNLTNKPILYVIGQELYDNDNHWIEFDRDIKLDPTKDQAPMYIIIPAYRHKLISVNLKRTSGRPMKNHGISKRERFYLRYHDKDVFIKEGEPKLTTAEFFERW